MATQSEFLRAILPEEAYIAVVGIKGKVPKQQLVSSVSEALGIVTRHVNAGRDAYFGCAGYGTNASRKKDNVLAAKSFWVDLDCGAGTPYQDYTQGVTAVKNFCQASGMPKPWTIASGRGLHVYWPLETPVTPRVWERGASCLVSLAAHHSLFIKDVSCSTDIARILRVPGTLNFKDPAHPLPVEIVHVGNATSFQELKSVLMRAPTTSIPPLPRLSRPPADDTTQSLIQDAPTAVFKTIVRRSIAGDGCAQIAWAAQQPGLTGYNLWRAVLSIAKFCVDGEEGAHRISRQHPGYDAQEVNRKLNDIAGPYTCDKIAEAGGAQRCALCACKGNFKSPIALGQPRRISGLPMDAEGNPVLPQDVRTFHIGNLTPAMLHAPLPAPYVRGEIRGIYYPGSKADDGGPAVPIEVYPYNLNVSARVLDNERGECLLCTLELPHDEVKEFVVPAAAIVQPDLLKSHLAKQGVIGHKGRMTDVSTYIVNAAMNLQETTAARPAVTQMGWNETLDAFVVGRKVYTRSNPRGEYSPPADSCREIAQRMGIHGQFEPWHALALQFAKPGCELQAMALLVAMGSMLNPFSDDCDPIWMHLVSSVSGTGKTSLMHLMNGVWGHPKALMLGPTDTYNALSKIRVIHNSIAVCQDEITNMDAQALSRIAYSQSQDRDKNRLDPSAKAKANNETRTNAFITSGNRYVTDVIGAMKSSAGGELARILEITFPALNNVLPAGLGFGQARSNYGHCGDMLATWAVTHTDELHERVASHVTAWRARLHARNSERNWIGATATGMAMLEICQKELGILQAFDTDRIGTCWEAHLRGARSGMSDAVVSPEDLIGDFLNEHHGNIVLPDEHVPDSTTDAISEHRMRPVRDARFKICVRVERKTGRFFISAAELKTYCDRRHASYLELHAYYEKRPEFKGIIVKRMGAGTGVVSAPTRAWEMVLTGSEWGAMLDDLPG